MGKNIRIGDLRHRITFQESIEVDDDIGGKEHVSWMDVVTVWGSVEPLSGREYFYAHQIKSDVTHRVTIRYQAGVDHKWRIKFGDRYFKIESLIDMEEKHRFIQIFCKEEV